MNVLPKTRAGYADFGSIRIPPMPSYIVMTSRDDGSEWFLSHNSDFSRFTINDTLPAGRFDVYRFGPFEGPYIGKRGDPYLFRLFMRDRHLGYEVVATPPGLVYRNQAPIYSRRVFEPRSREVQIPSDFRLGHGLQHTSFDFA